MSRLRFQTKRSRWTWIRDCLQWSQLCNLQNNINEWPQNSIFNTPAVLDSDKTHHMRILVRLFTTRIAFQETGTCSNCREWPRTRPLIPPRLRRVVTERAHETDAGIIVTSNMMKLASWWPELFRDIDSYEECLRKMKCTSTSYW